MKTVKEIKEMRLDWGGREAGDDTLAVDQIFDVLVGITEHLEAQEKPCDKRAIWGQVDPEVRDVMERLLAAEKRQKKLEEWTENAIPGDIIHMTKTTKAEIERAAMIEALRWADRVTQSGGVEYSAIGKAIARLENGGDL